MPRKNTITLRELSPAEIPGIFPLIAEHNPGMSQRTFSKRLAEMMPLGYRAVAVFKNEQMIGISGFWIGMRFWCGKLLDIDNFYIHETHRNVGIGVKLLQWLEAKAVEENCQLMVLDVYSQSFLAHRFYHRNGFVMTGYHMTKVPGTTIPFVAGRHS